MSDSALPKKPTAAKPETQFTTENIGRWAAKQENPFAAQNRKAAAKKQKQAETRKKATPYVVVVAATVAIGLAIFGLVVLIITLLNNQPKLPDNLTLGSDGAAEISEAAQNVYQEQLQKFYNQHGNNASGSVEQPNDEAVQDALNAVSDYYNEQKDKATTDDQKTQIGLLEMRTLGFMGRNEDLIRIGLTLDENLMGLVDRSYFYGIMANAYYSIGNIEMGDYYLDKDPESAEGN